MRSFYLVVNGAKERAWETAGGIGSYLAEKGAACHVGKRGEGPHGLGAAYTDPEDVPEDVDCVLTLGGDGTLIQAARDLSMRHLPMMGINLGTLGYLTQVSAGDNLAPVLDMLLQDECRLEERMMLDGRACHLGKETYRNLALNEIVITRKDLMKVIRFQIFVNGEFLSRWTADGVIIATPTGSTAYNLSAGGPIVQPGSQMTIMTPICAHSLNARSIVLSADDRITIVIEGGGDRAQVAVFDGDGVAELGTGDSVDICRSETVTTMVRLRHMSFLENLRDKMAGI